MTKVVVPVSFCMAVITLFLWVTTDDRAKLYGTVPRWRKDYLLTNTLCIVLLFAAMTMITAGLGDKSNGEKYLCANKAVPIDQSDGASACLLQSAIIDYASLAFMYSWFAVSVDLYLKVIKGMKSTDQYFWVYMALIHIPAVSFVGMLAIGEQLGYDGVSNICQYVTPRLKRSRSYLFYPIDVSMLTSTIGGFVLVLLCSRRYIKTWLVLRRKLLKQRDSHDIDDREEGNYRRLS
jgi:hypothetical protein